MSVNSLASVNLRNTLGLGNIATISLNGNGSQFLNGNGVFANAVTSVSTSGSGLGFSLGGGPITTTGTITLTIPTDTGLRTSLNIGNVANINLNGNGSQVLAGNGSWVAQTGGGGTGTVTQVDTSGSGLGFSLGGGPITTTGTITLTIPTDTGLRTSLNIGNVANINLNGNSSQFLAGDGTFASSNPSSLANLINAFEVVTLHTTTSGTYNHNFINSSISYSTSNATANITVNFRGNSTVTLESLVSLGKSVTGVYIMTTGSTGYIPNTIQVDGITQTIRYAANASPIAISNTVCSYTYTIIRTQTSPAAWVVFGSQTRYG